MEHLLQYAKLRLPENWEDRTTYQFVSPAEPLDSLPLLTGKKATTIAARINCVISRIRIEPSQKLSNFVDAQEQAFRQSLDKYVLESKEPWVHPQHGSIPVIDMTFEFQPGLSLRQAHAFFATANGNTLVNLTLSAEKQIFSKRLRELQKIFQDFNLTKD